MTAQIVDEMTDTPSDKNRECTGQGIANFVSGFFGGMAGCAMIGQSVINVKSGGRGRLSTFTAGVFLLILLVLLESVGETSADARARRGDDHGFDRHFLVGVVQEPARASEEHEPGHDRDRGRGRLDAQSRAGRRRRRAAQRAVLCAQGRADHPRAQRTRRGRPRRAPTLCRARSSSLRRRSFSPAFDFKEAVAKVRIDVSHAHFWDLTSVGALDKVVLKFRREGAEVEIIGLNEASATIVDRLAIHDKPDALERMLEH